MITGTTFAIWKACSASPLTGEDRGVTCLLKPEELFVPSTISSGKV